MKINYGIRQGKGKAAKSQNHSAEVPNNVTLQDVLNLVAEKHPGWLLMGYAPANRECD